jgi:hypothetical protein
LSELRSRESKITEERSSDERADRRGGCISPKAAFDICSVNARQEPNRNFIFAKMRIDQSDLVEMRQNQSAICRRIFESFEQTERFAHHDFTEM